MPTADRNGFADSEMISRGKILGIGLAAAAATGAYVTVLYRQAIDAAHERISPTRSKTIPTRFGTLEYAEQGDGPAILMIHGSGGGFDQGLLFGSNLAAAGYRVIAPSRFGYLRSDYPDDSSPESQADVLVELLDALDVERAAVAGLSAGAPAALAFALRHPHRCAALLPIVPASYVPDGEQAAPWSALQEFAVNAVLRSDFLFWAFLHLAPDFVTKTILATDPTLVASHEAQQQVAAIRQGLLPVSARARGLANDMRRSAKPPHLAYERITVPTLAISADDDLYGTAAAARFIAQSVPGAKAHIFPDGGHILIGREAEMRALVDSFLRQIEHTQSF